MKHRRDRKDIHVALDSIKLKKSITSDGRDMQREILRAKENA